MYFFPFESLMKYVVSSVDGDDDNIDDDGGDDNDDKDDQEEDMIAEASHTDVIISDMNNIPSTDSIKEKDASSKISIIPSEDLKGDGRMSSPTFESGFSPLNRSIIIKTTDNSNWRPSRPEKQRD